MSERDRETNYQKEVPLGLAIRCIGFGLGFVMLMALPTILPEGHPFLGENNIRLWLIVCAYIPVCGIIEYLISRNSLSIKNKDE